MCGGAAAQQDGGACEGGKGLTIWDKPFIDGHIKNGDDCSVACDHFHRWKEDFKILKEIGVNTYRFSVCPHGYFKTNLRSTGKAYGSIGIWSRN